MRTGIEQRKHRRYNIAIPVKLKRHRRNAQPTIASSRDISAQGIYLTVSKDYRLGSSIDLDLELPLALAQGAGVRIHCRAKIIRVDKLSESDNVGVAAQIISYKFIRNVPDKADVA